MSRAARWGVVPVVLALVAGASACETIADLGNEATLRTDPANCGAGTGESNAMCTACTEKKCNEKANACYEHDCECREGVDCLLLCAYQLDCIPTCNERYGRNDVYAALYACVTTDCSQECIGGPKCTALGACCVKLPESTRRACAGIAATADETACASRNALFCAGTATDASTE